MRSSTLAVIASSTKVNYLLDFLYGSDIDLLFCSHVSNIGIADLTLICLESSVISQKPASPWLAWDQTGDSQVISRAYQAGAQSVFPKETPANVIVEVIRRTMNDIIRNSTLSEQRKQRAYRRGELILLEEDEVLHIEKGIFATTMIHQDGVEVLLGLSGKGQIIVAHPEDNCHIQIVAHTDAGGLIESWHSAVQQPGFMMKLRTRLQQMEGWAAMQARPSLQQRVIRLLELLAEQFGVPSEQGTLIDVRITHTQLAAAVGATRTSITRVISELRAQERVSTVLKGGEVLFYLTESPEHPYHF